MISSVIILLCGGKCAKPPHGVSSKTLPSIGISHGRDHNRQDTRYQCWDTLQSVRTHITIGVALSRKARRSTSIVVAFFLAKRKESRECVTPTLLNILRRGFTAPGHRHSQTAAPSVHSSHTRRSSPDTAAIMPSSARYPAFAPSTSTHCPPPTERESRGDLHRAADPSHSGQSCGALRVPRRAHATEDPRESRGSLSREIRSCA